MQVSRLLLLLSAGVLFCTQSKAQQTLPTSAPQTLLRQSLTALTGPHTLNDITLIGTARRIAGSDNESGAVTLRAHAAGQSRLDLTLPSGTHAEVHDIASVVPSGKWHGPDGAPHDVVYHNLVAEPFWPAPALLVARLLTSPTAIVTDRGQEIRNGVTVQHLNILQNSRGTSEFEIFLQHLSAFDLYLDQATLLPVAVAFNLHPDNNARIDIAVEIRYSDYRAPDSGSAGASSLAIPFHIEKFINNGLILDLQFTSATTNSGLTAADFVLK